MYIHPNTLNFYIIINAATFQISENLSRTQQSYRISKKKSLQPSVSHNPLSKMHKHMNSNLYL